MILRFQRYTKIGIIAVISIIFLVIVGCAILIFCNWFPMLAYMEGILGKRVYYNMEERGPSAYATDEAFAESGIGIHWVNTDAMSDYFYPRYKAYNAVMSKFLTRSTGLTGSRSSPPGQVKFSAKTRWSLPKSIWTASPKASPIAVNSIGDMRKSKPRTAMPIKLDFLAGETTCKACLSSTR